MPLPSFLPIIILLYAYFLTASNGIIIYSPTKKLLPLFYHVFCTNSVFMLAVRNFSFLNCQRCSYTSLSTLFQQKFVSPLFCSQYSYYIGHPVNTIGCFLALRCITNRSRLHPSGICCGYARFRVFHYETFLRPRPQELRCL